MNITRAETDRIERENKLAALKSGRVDPKDMTLGEYRKHTFYMGLLFFAGVPLSLFVFFIPLIGLVAFITAPVCFLLGCGAWMTALTMDEDSMVGLKERERNGRAKLAAWKEKKSTHDYNS